jgi:anti-sigma B factor antagonist
VPDVPDVPEPFRVEIAHEGGVVRVCPVGEVDLATVGEIEARIQELRAAGCTCVLMDLRGTTFLDCSGLRLVLEAQASSAADGWDFGLIEGSERVQRVFAVTGLDRRLRFVHPQQDGAPRSTDQRRRLG